MPVERSEATRATVFILRSYDRDDGWRFIDPFGSLDAAKATVKHIEGRDLEWTQQRALPGELAKWTATKDRFTEYVIHECEVL